MANRNLGDRRTQLIAIVCSEGEKALIESYAMKDRLSLSTFCLQIIMSELQKKENKKHEGENVLKDF